MMLITCYYKVINYKIFIIKQEKIKIGSQEGFIRHVNSNAENWRGGGAARQNI